MSKQRMLCHKHRRYKAVLPPRVPCRWCWEMFIINHTPTPTVVTEKVLDAIMRLHLKALHKGPKTWAELEAMGSVERDDTDQLVIYTGLMSDYNGRLVPWVEPTVDDGEDDGDPNDE